MCVLPHVHIKQVPILSGRSMTAEGNKRLAANVGNIHHLVLPAVEHQLACSVDTGLLPFQWMLAL